LPVAVIGAGPVGLAAAARLVEAGEEPVVLEAGQRAGAAVLGWGHVRVFSPWKYNVDEAARRLLLPTGWSDPDPEVAPTGGELVERYLEPLARSPRLRGRIRPGSRVTAVSRRGFDKLRTAGREAAPFELTVRTPEGEERLAARAVIDASGTWGRPNPLGSSGVPAPGESAAAERIFFGIPDVLGRHRARYAGRRVVVVGSGHSAFNTLLDLVLLRRAEPTTEITWAIRRVLTEQLFGGGAADALPDRATLGAEVRRLVVGGHVRLVAGFATAAVELVGGGVLLRDAGGAGVGPVDEVVACTGFRPDLDLGRELRLAFDPVVESPPALAPLIDPNLHSCGTVPPHGARELAHPEADYYVVGMKSYGRAPTFLMLTGYEQVRSVVCALKGDEEGARSVRLVLPETGVCSTQTPVPVASGSGLPVLQPGTRCC
jgi:Pyridine nucleotide-disulphide oxidoreductase